MPKDHKAIVQAESERIYANRNYILHRLDTRVFNALNQTPVYRDEHGELHEAAPAPILALNGYCLDALDEIPQGCMKGFEGKNTGIQYISQGFTVRHMTWAEIQECSRRAKEIIDQILKEIKDQGD